MKKIACVFAVGAFLTGLTGCANDDPPAEKQSSTESHLDEDDSLPADTEQSAPPVSDKLTDDTAPAPKKNDCPPICLFSYCWYPTNATC